MSGGTQQANSASEQKVWKPWGEATTPLLREAESFYDPAMDQIRDPQLQQDMQEWNAGVTDTASSLYDQQAQGGNLAGYDIAGDLYNSMTDQSQLIDVNDYNAETYDANQVNAVQVGDVTNSNAADWYGRLSGGDGGVGQMNDMYRRQAGLATDDMLSAVDARAAASGMSGGSRQGTAIGRGMEGINANLQNQMAQTGYDAYNRNIDNVMNIAGTTDQYNQQRALSDQSARNQFRAANSQAKNTARGANAAAMNQAGLANQGVDLQGQQANLQSQLQQQQQMQQLLGMQNANQQGALDQTGAMMGLGQTGYQEALAPFTAYSQLLQGMGGSTVLSDSVSSSSGKQGGLL